MGDYLKLFETHAEYEEARQNLILPNVSHCKDQNELHYNPIPHDYSKDYLTFVAKERGTFTFTPQTANVISYSTDGGENWIVGNSVEVRNGKKVLWRGEMTPSSTESTEGIGTFSSTAEFDVQGNIMSLLFGDDYKGQTDLTGKDYAFYKLFYQNTKLLNTEKLSLPATTLSESCYRNMFNGCSILSTSPILPATTLANGCYQNMLRATNITTAPELHATTLASNCYRSMFYQCPNLTTAPELPATDLTGADYCYYCMFYQCSKLTSAPILPATTLASYCYTAMFYGCTSITIVPELPATTLAPYCYQTMFYGCTSITVVPELPATTLAPYCYNYMFQNCTSLTTVTNLPATDLVGANYCYDRMFRGDSKLNYVKAMFLTDPMPDRTTKLYTNNWLYGVSSTGTFVKNVNATWTERSEFGIPKNWTVETASE